MDFLKGMLIGLGVGAAAALGVCMMTNCGGKQLRRGAKKAINAMEELVGEVEALIN